MILYFYLGRSYTIKNNTVDPLKSEPLKLRSPSITHVVRILIMLMNKTANSHAVFAGPPGRQQDTCINVHKNLGVMLHH